MKVRVSATIDEKTNKKLDEFLKNSRYRNKSHIVEEAINGFINKEVKNARK
jgi:metal-responsive CopG/Arc/MetJ family transcriptional regulator